MKQEITIPQLEELTHDQTMKLNDWCRERGYRLSLTIGQMIQFIQENKPLLKGISKNRFDKWFVNIDNGMLGYKDELCDALWETVKQLLKQP